MPSPLPGMDPYIEDSNLWSDFHGILAGEIRNALNRVMTPRYVARIIPRTTYEIVEIDEKTVFPDLGILEQPHAESTFQFAAIATTAPTAESLVEIEYETRAYDVEIRQVKDMRLVTHIEILSPANKRQGHKSFEEYQTKRRDILNSSAHLVEIDLLRRGTRPRLERPVPAAPYYITISQRNKRPRVNVWSIQLNDKLPILPIPVLDPDPDVPLDLGSCATAVYDNGRYATQIDYRESPPPPKLSPQETEYVDSLLKPLREHA